MLMNKNSRVLVNIIGIPLIIFSIYIGGVLFNIFVSIIILLGIREFINLSIKSGSRVSIGFLYLSNIIFIIINNYLGWLNPESVIQTYLILCFSIIPFVIISMIIEIFKKSNNPLLNISSTIFGFLWIGVFLSALIPLREMAGPILTLSIIISIWVCDTFAFFFGKKFGKMKILPDISPNKTWIGTLSGLFGAILFLMILSYFKFLDLSIFQSICVGIITGGISQFGDFFESALKRSANIKDTSNILRGHGGILDRFDSLFISAPLLLFSIMIIKFING
jgi:phosphatidate cytidylyltransferase